MVHRMYIRYRREQQGVVERETDCGAVAERSLGNIVGSRVQSSLYIKYENHCYETSHDDTLYTNILAARFVGEQMISQKRVCESLDERYLFFNRGIGTKPPQLFQ